MTRASYDAPAPDEAEDLIRSLFGLGEVDLHGAMVTRTFDDGEGELLRRVRELVGPRDAVLEFQVEIDGITVNGVDMVRWNDEGRIVDFKVMVRPLKAIQLIHQKMGAMLQAHQQQ